VYAAMAFKNRMGDLRNEPLIWSTNLILAGYIHSAILFTASARTELIMILNEIARYYLKDIFTEMK
jgi:hypothetical protein